MCVTRSSIRPGAVALLYLLVLWGCDLQSRNPDQVETRSLEQIQADGTLIVLTRNAPTTYYIDRHGTPAGPEYDLVTAFAGSIGVEVEFELRPTVDAILNALEAGEGDLAAAGLTVLESREKRFRFGPSYQQVTQQVVCRRRGETPESVAELVASSNGRRTTTRPPSSCWRTSGPNASTARWPTRPSSISTGATIQS